MAYTIRFEPVGKQVTYDEPRTLLAAAQDAEVGILALCGGTGSCGRCRVLVQGGGLSPLSDRERDALSEREMDAGYRLACQVTLCADVVAYVPEISRPQAQKLQIEGCGEPVACCPPVRKVLLDLPVPTLADPRADLRRVEDALRAQHSLPLSTPDLVVLSIVGETLRPSSAASRAGPDRANRSACLSVTASLRGSELIQIEPGDTTPGAYGIAVDLGTTKIAVYLADLESGTVVDALGLPNPQVAYGEDVIARIGYAARHADGTSRLQWAVVEELNRIVRSLCEARSLDPSEILEFTVVGNTAMHHLFLGLPTAQLARSPCVPIVARPLHVKAREVGLDAAPGAYVYCPPPVAGFVGSDHVAMILASRLDLKEGTHLGIDIGTNTEISLVRGGKIRAVSCASGPAFEGAAICWGMKAAPGAIEHVWIDPRSSAVHVSTVEDEPPVGICGSGILDCVADMLRAGMLDQRGRIQAHARGVQLGPEGLPELVLAEGRNGAAITVTQRDVQRIQLAKGAIRSGIEVLLHADGITSDQIDGVLLAGAFGTYIDPLSAMAIGLLPAMHPDHIAQVGNAAGVGAKAMLVSTDQRRIAEAIATQVQYLELTVYPRYSRIFARALRF